MIAVVLRIRIRGREVRIVAVGFAMVDAIKVDIFPDPDTVDAVQQQPDSPYVRGPAMAPLTKVSVMAQVSQSVRQETCDMVRLHVRNTATAHQSPDSTSKSGIVRDKDISQHSPDVHPERAEKDTFATNLALQPLPALANSAHITSRHGHEEPEEPEEPYGALHADVQAQVQVQGRMVTGTCKTGSGNSIMDDHLHGNNDRVPNGYVRIPYLGIRMFTRGLTAITSDKVGATVSKPTVVKPVERGPIAVAAPAWGALGLPLWRSKVNVLDKKVANLHFSDQKKEQARIDMIRNNSNKQIRSAHSVIVVNNFGDRHASRKVHRLTQLQ